MKKMKKMMALLIAVVMMMAMSMTTMAASIQVENPVGNQTYTAYKLFDVTYLGTNYSYTIDSEDNPIFTFIDNYGKNNANTFSLSNVVGTTVYNVVMDSSFTEAGDLDDSKAKAFAAALNTKIASLSNLEKEKLTPVKISGKTNVELGYYFVDSTFGSLCALTTADAEATIIEKNIAPTVTKKIVENSSEVSSTTATIGDIIKYKLTVTVPTSVEGAYEITDTLPKGICSVDKIAIEGLTENTDYSEDYNVNSETGIGTLKININAEKVKEFISKGYIEITYEAKLDEDANIGTAGNVNSAKLKYNEYTTTSSEATVFTYQFGLVKTDQSKNVISEAEFELYDAQTGGKRIYVKENGTGVYRVTTETNDVKISAGNVTIQGLGNGTYWLQETAAPAGYNKLVARESITIEGANKDATVTDNVYSSGGIRIVNQAGSLLPETGGIGTTIFYAAGALLVIGGVVVLVTRKRMENQ